MSERFTIPPYQNAIVREAAVDEVLSPQDSVQFALNFHFDRIGAIVRRNGTTLLGAQISAGTPVLGMGVYRNNAGTTFAALAKVGSAVKVYTGGAWTDVRTGLDASSKARFTNFVDYTFMVNGHDHEGVQTWGGGGNFGNINTASLPRGDFIENYRSRIWVADNSDDKVYYSDVVTTAGTITGGTSFIQVSPADGERITGLVRHPSALLVFKQNHIYRIVSTTSIDPDPAILRGTYSHESIVQAKDGIYYHHPTGFYKFVFSGDQEELSRPITDIIQAIPRASYDNITGWSDDDHVYWSIGDITLDGVALTNLVCRRTISTKLWTIYSYPQEFRSQVLYDNGTDLIQLLGDTDGNVLQFDTGNSDNGSPIYFDVITHWLYFTDNKSTQKTISKMNWLHENAQGARVTYQLDSDNQKNTNNAWRTMGDFKKDVVQNFSLDASNFYRIRFRVSGNSSGTACILRNIEVLDLVTTNEE